MCPSVGRVGFFSSQSWPSASETEGKPRAVADITVATCRARVSQYWATSAARVVSLAEEGAVRRRNSLSAT